MFGKALYYPTIDIEDEDWLKNAYLFWDSIYTIVPQSLKGKAYNNNTTQYLEEEGFLKSLTISPDAPVVMSMAKYVKEYAKTEEGKKYLNSSMIDKHYTHAYNDERSVFYIHQGKLPHEIQRMMGYRRWDDEWVRVNGNFANYYMTLLANIVSRQNSLALLTSEKNHDSLGTFLNVNTYTQPYTLAQSNVESIGRCLLTQLVIEGIRLDPLTSIERLQDFKTQHEEELKRFRNGFERIAKMEIPPDITVEGLEQKVKDIYENDFLLEYRNLQNALKGSGIRFLVGGAATLAFSDVSTSFLNEVLSDIPYPKQLMIGAGAVLAYKGFQTIVGNRNTKQNHRMSYLLSIEKELGNR